VACDEVKASLAIDQNKFGNKLVYVLYWTSTTPYTTRNLYYGFVPPPDVFIDGKQKDYTSITKHTALVTATSGKSGVDLQLSFDGSLLNGTVVNTATESLDQLILRVFRINQADMVSHPNEVTEIIAELPLAALALQESDTFSVNSITLGPDERLVVFVQDDVSRQIYHGIYVPQIP